MQDQTLIVNRALNRLNRRVRAQSSGQLSLIFPFLGPISIFREPTSINLKGCRSKHYKQSRNEQPFSTTRRQKLRCFCRAVSGDIKRPVAAAITSEQISERWMKGGWQISIWKAFSSAPCGYFRELLQKRRRLKKKKSLQRYPAVAENFFSYDLNLFCLPMRFASSIRGWECSKSCSPDGVQGERWHSGGVGGVSFFHINFVRLKTCTG